MTDTVIEFPQPDTGLTTEEVLSEAADLSDCIVIGKHEDGSLFCLYTGDDPHYINSLIDIAKAALIRDMVD